MGLFATILIGTGRALLIILQISMLLRALLSWFPISEDNPILLFVQMVTEPIIAPIRALFDKFGWFENFPLDVSFIVAYFLLMILQVVVGVFA